MKSSNRIERHKASAPIVTTGCRVAFKEWAAICAALASGRQTILLRKGGIHEPGGQFRPEHDAFWLFPTRFHQHENELSDEGRAFLAAAAASPRQPGTLELAQFARVIEAVALQREELLPALRPFHVYSDQVVSDRFRYKRPGLMLLLVRIYTLKTPHVIPDSPHFSGCRSWVELPDELSTENLIPVLPDDAFNAERGRIVSSASPGEVA